MTLIEAPRHLRVVRPPQDGPRRPRHRVLVAVTVALVAVTVWVLFGGLGQHHHSAATLPTTPPRQVIIPAAAPRPAGMTCPALSDRDQTIPQTAPPGVSWTLFDGVAVPMSGSRYGPAVVHGDLARCYSDTPVGAAIADIQISARDLIATDWRQVLATQVVPGPGVKVYAADRALVTGPAPAGTLCQTAGVAWLEYTPRVASIELVSRCAGNLQAVVTTMEWSASEHDWRLVLLDDGSETAAVTPVDGLQGFIPFGAI